MHIDFNQPVCLSERAWHLRCTSFRVSHTLQSALKSGQEARIVQIDFSAAFVGSTIGGILYKPVSVGIGSSVLYLLTQFLSNRSQ